MRGGLAAGRLKSRKVPCLSLGQAMMMCRAAFL